jgi:ribonuclease I
MFLQNFSNKLSTKMRRESPSLYKKSEELWKLQWEHHGQFSDLDCLEYYRQELFFHENCDVKKALEESNIYPSSAYLINTDFFKNQLTPKIGVLELQCNGEDLIEVRCCFERNGTRTNYPQTSGHCACKKKKSHCD